MKRITYKLGKVEVVIHSGYETIGGNIVEVKYPDGSLIFDIGLNIGLHNKYFTWPTKTHKGIEELKSLGIAPEVDGLYTRWIENGKTPDVEYGVDTHIRGVFISHVHLDHYGLITQLNRNIPIYMGETSRYILEIKMRQARNIKYNNYKDLQVNNTFRNKSKIVIDDVKIVPYHVDHSIPGAYSFKIETGDGVIVYTGDYRMHGQEESLTKDFIEDLEGEDIELFITEGTRVHDVEYSTEREVKEKLKWIVERTGANIIIEFSPLDIDRFLSILSAAYETGKDIYMDEKYFINISNYYINDPKLKEKLDRYSFREICKGLVDTERRRDRRHRELIEEISTYVDYVDPKDFRDGDIILGMDRGLDLCQKGVLRQDKIAIFSNSEPFNEEGEIDFNKTINWLTKFNIPSYRIHASGHISPLELKEVVGRLRPRDVIIIHSEYPELVKSMLGYK